MIFIQNKSIKVKLLIIILGVSLLSIFIGFTLNIIRETSSLRNSMISQTMMTAKLVSEYCITPLDFGYRDEAEANLSKLARTPSILNGLIYDAQGDLFASFNRIDLDQAPTLPVGGDKSWFEQNWLHLFQSIDYNDEQKGTIYLRVSTAQLSKDLRKNLFAILGIGLGVMVLAYIFASRMQKIISSPILDLADFSEKISREGDYTIRITREGSDEINTLYASFNNMLEQIHNRESERDIAEEEKTRLTGIIENTSDLVSMSGIDGNLVYMNQAGRNMLGWSPDAGLAVKSIPEIHPEWAYQIIKNVGIPTAFEKGFWQGETAILASNGVDIPVLQVIISHRSSSGKFKYLSTIMHNISDRKKAEEALRTSEEKHRQLVENLGKEYFFFTHDDSGKMNYVSPSVKDMLGYEPETFKNDYLIFVTQNPINEILEKKLQACLDGRKQAPYQIEMVHASGKTRWLEVTEGPVYSVFGDVVAVEGIAHDITEQKKVEDALKKAQGYISNIIDSMPSMIIGVDPQGIVTQWNNEAQRVTGITVTDAIGQPLEKMISRLTVQMERVQLAIQHREIQSDLQNVNSDDNIVKYEDVTIYPLIGNGVEGAVIRIDDVTEKVRMEKMMIQSEKMLSVGGLAAGMAHEINNPMAGILQTSNVLANRLSSTSKIVENAKAAESVGTTIEVIQKYMEIRGIPNMLKAISESGNRVSAIVNNMLSFARKSDELISSIDMSEMLDRTLVLAGTDYDLKKQYDFKQIKIIKDYQKDLPLVPGEEAKIQQVFLNIFRNGAQAMQTAGTTNSAFSIRTYHEREHNRVCIEISDNGPGMNELTRAHVFEPFFTTKPVGVGTGLGMSVSYFIITENHSGEIMVESQPGEGATFIIRLPIQR